MIAPKSTSQLRVRSWAIRLVLAVGIGGMIWGVREWNQPPRPTLDGLTLVAARRSDLRTTLRAGGLTESVSKTTISCRLEKIEMRSQAGAMTSGGASTILRVIPDGSTVKKGDVLCKLDSSEYEETVRLQEIRVDRARADLQQATLDYEARQMAVAEFKNGLMAQSIQECEGQLKLCEADLQRGKDRLAWASKMKGKGYVSTQQMTNDEQFVKKTELELTKARWTLANFRKFGAVSEAKSLDADVEIARMDLVFQRLRFDRTIERFEHYKRMVEFCTIKAPHDGFVIYVQPRRFNESTVEEGSRVRQGQDLFYLPDLAKMQVRTTLHESIVSRVRVGMTSRARIEGMGNVEVGGHVVKVDTLPDTENGWMSDSKFYKATIVLDRPPLGIRPQMTAQVEIDVEDHPGVIAVPSEALAYDHGKEYCYVAVDGALQRRAVKLGGSNRDMLEVTEGIAEGEEVVSDLDRIDEYASLIVDDPATHAEGGPSVAAHPAAVDPKAGL